MSLRPVPARWLEVLVARDDAPMALEALARTGAVELEIRGEAGPPFTLEDLEPRLQRYRRLAARYRPHWPAPSHREGMAPAPPARVLDDALERLEGWAREGDALVRRLEALGAEAGKLGLLREVLTAEDAPALDVSLLRAAGGELEARLYALPPEPALGPLPERLLVRWVHAVNRPCLILVGPPGELAEAEATLDAAKARALTLPEWLDGDAATAARRLAARLAEIEAEARQARESLERLAERHGLAEALGHLARLEWFLGRVERLPLTTYFAWITGWSSDLDGERLWAALDASGARALLQFTEAPPDADPPLIFHNPWWVRPFELFARLLGTPGAGEPDPSTLLAVVTPLMFGYMFGDVGQGLVLCLAGLALRRRLPALRLLIPGGLAAAAFGLVFGSVFSMEHVIPSLWVHPIEHPLPVLAVPLAAGALLLVLGQVLNGLAAAWQRRTRDWLAEEAPLLALYLALAAALLDTAALALAGLAALWFVAGGAVRRGGGALQAAARVGELLEHGIQLFVNTLSFVRVGAFALAHAGLSLAVVSLAEIPANRPVTLLILLLGNALIIALEGLVVSIQTTRLILFEFFVRFLRATGRGFRPLPAPPAAEPSPRRTS